MIDWLWLIPTFLVGLAFGWGGSRKFGAGVSLGIIGTILTFIGMN